MNTNVVNNYYEFMMIFDVKNGNPNGDPDADNAPRQIFETGHGYITDSCIKRKIRDFVNIYVENTEGYENEYNMFVAMDNLLNNKINEAIEKNITEEYKVETDKRKKKKMESEIKRAATDYMCETYFDVRAFGGVLTTGDGVDNTTDDTSETDKKEKSGGKKKGGIKGANAVKGPVQITFANGYSTFGHKYIVPYGLYIAKGSINPIEAKKTGFTEKDLELLWTSIINMFRFDKSASRGEMNMRKLIIFKHKSHLGSTCTDIFDRVDIHKVEGVEVPNSYKDYIITIDTDNILDDIECIIK